MGGPQPCINYKKRRDANDLAYSHMNWLVDQTDNTCEDGMQSINHWLGVRNWELMHQYQLEGVTDKLYKHGEKRGWFGAERNVFEMAPHRIANNSSYFKHTSEAKGAYLSNAWYQLQLVLNAGQRDPQIWFPQDWFYTGNWLALNSRRNEVNMSNFFVSNHLKMMQNLDTTGPDDTGEDYGPGQKGWWISFTHPWRLESRLQGTDGFPLNQIDEYESGLRRKVANAFLRNWMDKMYSYDIDELPRQSDVNKAGGDLYEHKDYVVDRYIPNQGYCYYSCPSDGGQNARDFYRMMLKYRDLGVDKDLRGEIIDWLKAVWPNPQNKWDDLR